MPHTPKDHIIDTYRERFPKRAYATDDFSQGLFEFNDIDAITKALVQHNNKNIVAWMVYDIDRETASNDWIDAGLPAPNILAINPDNGHAHLFYGLTKPVYLYANSREKPRRYLAAIDAAITEQSRADPGYAKLISKNPLHERWIVTVPHSELYSLDDLAKWLELDNIPKKRPQRDTETGYGRNVRLFDETRFHAYAAIRKYEEFRDFRRSVSEYAHSKNVEHNRPPLPENEVNHVIKSISNWTWRNMSAEGFRQWGEKRREKARAVKISKKEQQYRDIEKTIKDCPLLSRQDVADLHGVTKRTIQRAIQWNTQREGVTNLISD